MRKSLCTRCGKMAMVNDAWLGHDRQELCAECYDAWELLITPNPAPMTCIDSGPNHSNPWLENAVRALEEDR